MNIPSKLLIEQIETAITEAVRPCITEAYWVTHYGAFDINPKNLCTGSA